MATSELDAALQASVMARQEVIERKQAEEDEKKRQAHYDTLNALGIIYNIFVKKEKCMYEHPSKEPDGWTDDTLKM
jgi:hypothetical protein